MKIITGNPGTGKHTIANIVAKRLDLKIIDINKVAIDTGTFSKNRGVLDVNVTKLKKIIDRKSTKNSLLVGHLAPYVVSPKNVEVALVLRKNPYKLECIYKKRKYTKKKSLENLGSEILGIVYYDTISAFGKKKTRQIDTTILSIPTTAKKAEAILSRKTKQDDGVDWLQLILKKGHMRKFFPY